MTDDDSERYRAPALDKGLDILELLARTDGGLTQIEIAKSIGKSPNELYRMLDRLVRRGYVQRLDGDRFSLTLKMFGLAHFHAPIRRLVSFAAPVMRDFSASAEQACHLAVYDRGSVVVIAQQESSTYWAMSMRVGAQMSLFHTGSGHVLLAFQTEAQRQIMITEQVRGSGETVPPDLAGRLAEVRKNGFESMDSLQTAGVRNISAPVLTLDGTALAVITCPYITPLGGKAPTREACEALIREAAKRISEVATGNGNF
ncbi:IclR family transcriptional regulator [Agrobacterium tumefaciens]|uniref:IclR family transcriptional regulator n=1 Tax=Agrobacterium TaxID=357 RepID=UPI00115ECFE3|nr:MULTISPECIES: IclR family transcriptional regulator [Agrobacterium]MBS0256395.1 IclR family transcriptional regulator [Pseudomonadota bacterium]MCZ7496748.1 IclR family transcriptional regulator [Rhizobium rhizogenes]MDA5242654.1 IclR family transcriptional regulator [Agrobacterium sp. MAFF310724]MDA5247913.1 IclR family transcriptional regulator [Agrobacterium sp. MAFF210268]NSZ01273.1 IclR family transcriptional regulator [Agrobacterium tumefaciens]